MSTSIIHDAGMIGSGVSITSGIMMWFGENASAIGAIVACCSFILTAIFLFLNYRLNVKAYKLRQREGDK